MEEDKSMDTAFENLEKCVMKIGQERGNIFATMMAEIEEWNRRDPSSD